ncbi:hypothetical protein ACQ4PT_069760 [Festuca glaucescens]
MAPIGDDGGDSPRKASAGEVTRGDGKASLGEEKLTPVQIKRSAGEEKVTFVQIERSAGEEDKLTPVQIKPVGGEEKLAHVQIKPVGGEEKLTHVQIKLADGEGIKPSSGQESTEVKRASSPKRGLTEIEETGGFNGDLKRQRSCEGELLQDSTISAHKFVDLGPEDFGDVQQLSQDVLTLKRNFAVDIGKDYFFNQLAAKRLRSSEIPVIAQSPKEALTLAKTLRSFAKLTNKAENNLMRREVAANIRDLHQDHREVRQDHRDVRQDHRDVRQESTQLSLDESKRQLDMYWAQLDALRAAPFKGTQEVPSDHKNHEDKNQEEGPKEEKNLEEPKEEKNQEEGPKEEKNLEEPKEEKNQEEGPTEEKNLEEPKEEKNQEGETLPKDVNTEEGAKTCLDAVETLSKKLPNAETVVTGPKTDLDVAGTITKKLEKAETVVTLGGKAVELGEKAADVASRAGDLGKTAVEKSKTLQKILAGIVTCASSLAKRALEISRDDDGAN